MSPSKHSGGSHAGGDAHGHGSSSYTNSYGASFGGGFGGGEHSRNGLHEYSASSNYPTYYSPPNYGSAKPRSSSSRRPIY